jgi:hypothetical protein
VGTKQAKTPKENSKKWIEHKMDASEILYQQSTDTSVQ